MKKESRQKETLGRILKYMKKYWLFLGLSIALAVISVILTLYIPILKGLRHISAPDRAAV